MRPSSLLVLTAALACSSGEGAGPSSSSSPAGAPAAPSAGASLVESFVAQHAARASEPAGAVHVWLLAASTVGSDDPATRSAGLAALTRLTAPFRSEPDWKRLPSYGTFVRRLKSHPHVFRSYFVGTSPDNAYALPGEPVLDVLSVEEDGDRGTRVVVRSSGADSPRPLHVKKSRKDGLYYVSAFDNLYLDVRLPVDPDAEF